ncbi:MAG: hypothetical protein ACFCUG_08875 [Thiotrichales bacterium]
MTTPINRRRFIAGLFGFATAPGAVAAQILKTTPTQSRGPFYPLELPLDSDNDLTRVEGRSQVAAGEITELSGRLIGLDGRPLRATRIEIWQCDAHGYYHHPHDRGGQADPDFQGYGQTVSNSDGEYRFRTIRPVAYPGRTPHIHVAVHQTGSRPFVTQIYIAGEPDNTDDMLFRRIPHERRPLVEARFETVANDADARWRARFDIVLDATAV